MSRPRVSGWWFAALAVVLTGCLEEPGNAHDWANEDGAASASTTSTAPATTLAGDVTTIAPPSTTSPSGAPTVAPPPISNAPAGTVPPTAAPVVPATLAPAVPVTAAPVTSPPAASSQVAACAAIVPLGAMSGDGAMAERWNAAGGSLATVRIQCEELGRVDPGSLEAIAGAWKRYSDLAQMKMRETSYPCDGNYSPCIPNDPVDVDCIEQATTGDGPTWTRLVVFVTGVDEYGLDPDGDGFGCEPGQFG